MFQPQRDSGGAEPWWPRGWWKIMDTRIGIIPIPVFVILFALLVGFTYTGDIKGEVSMMIAVLVDRRLHLRGNRQAHARAAQHRRRRHRRDLHSLRACLLQTGCRRGSRSRSSSSPSTPTSSISSSPASSSAASSGMDRRCSFKGFFEDLRAARRSARSRPVPLAPLSGRVLGLGAYHTFFFVVVPIMAGGVGEGAIPLSIGDFGNPAARPQGDVFAQSAAAGNARQPDAQSFCPVRSISSASDIRI